MQKNECIRFLEESVGVGVPHMHEPRPFYFYGIIKAVTDKYLTLSYAGGVKQILLDDIIEIRIAKTKETRRHY